MDNNVYTEHHTDNVICWKRIAVKLGNSDIINVVI